LWPFFFRWIGGTAAFWGALAAEALVLALHFSHAISYLWYNPIGCAACVVISILLQAASGSKFESRQQEDA